MSPEISGEGMCGAFRTTRQAMLVEVTSPSPVGRIAIVGPLRPEAE
jgi:hypothetical protein